VVLSPAASAIFMYNAIRAVSRVAEANNALRESAFCAFAALMNKSKISEYVFIDFKAGLVKQVGNALAKLKITRQLLIGEW
jgi:hypothetical protein